MLVLRGLARRYQHLDAESTQVTRRLDQLTTTAAPKLRELLGVGPDSAAALLICAGNNPRRLHSEAAFAAPCGNSPVQASSGKTHRHRLNRRGDRQTNAALHSIVIVRLRWHQPTRDCAARRTTEGKTRKEIIRGLKRYLSRGIFTVLRTAGHGEPDHRLLTSIGTSRSRSPPGGGHASGRRGAGCVAAAALAAPMPDR